MTESEQLEAAKGILSRITRNWVTFEKWPEGDGWLVVDDNTDLSVRDVEFLSMIVQPQAAPGLGGLPADWGEEDGES